MMELRKSEERGHANHGWLDSYHSFSFADYYDPQHMGFGALRVINEDWINAGAGFGTHGHRDMEILTYVLDGELAHKDSMGNGSVIRPGDVQRMSAGSGVRHSEYNHAADRQTHLLQIWIEPNVRGRRRLIASPDSREDAVLIHQDASVYAGLFDGDERASFALRDGRRAYVHVARGQIKVNGTTLQAGDAAKISAESQIEFSEGKQAEALLFDLA